MANVFGKTLLGIVAACVASGFASAQESKQQFDAAMRLLRTNKKQEALQALEALVASSPSSAEYFDLWVSTDEENFFELNAQGGEFRKISLQIMSMARVQRAELSRDAEAIATQVEAATSGDYGERSIAMGKLAAEHGEFAVPALIAILGDSNADKKQNFAILTLRRIGTPTVMPLLAALDSDNALLRRNVAATLVLIADARAAATFARLQKQDDNSEVREVAAAGLKDLGVTPGASAIDLFMTAANSYLVGSGFGARAVSEVVWNLKDGALVATDVPAVVYHLELAKRDAHAAMALDPSNAQAQALIARSYLAQAAAIEDYLASGSESEAMQELAGTTGLLRMVAMATGNDTLRKAMVDSLSAGQNVVAIECIRALAKTEDLSHLTSSPLVAALDHADAQVKYAAALAMTQVSRGNAMPAADKVVANLGLAVQEEAIRLVKIVGCGDWSKNVASASSKLRGVNVTEASTGAQAVSDVFSFPKYDIVIINEVLPNDRPEHIVSLIAERAPNIKILIKAKSEDAAERFGDKIAGVITEDLDGAALIAKATELLGDMDSIRARATKVAVAASEALEALAENKVSIAGAVVSLEAQLNRGDNVALPAAKALGEGGNAGSIKPLGVILSGDGSLELKIASAQAIGNILARIGELPDGCFGTLAAIAGDAGQDESLRTAAVTALGKGKLAPGDALKLVEKLKR